MSVGDLLDDWFECDAFKGAMASSGVVGVWAGPRTPGTAYNLLHHELGEIDGVTGLWGHVKGGMGAISMAIARSAEASGATIRTGASVRSIDVSGGHTVGVTLDTGEEILAPVVVSGAHPKTTVLDMVGAEHFPDDVADDMRTLPHARRVGEGQLGAVGAAALRGRLRRGPEPARALGRGVLPVDRHARARVAGRLPRRAGRDRRTSRSRRRRRSTRRSPTTARRSSRCSPSTARTTSPAGRRARATRTPTAAWRSSPSARRT